MEFTTMIGLGLVGMLLAVLLKQYKPEYAVAAALVVGVLLFVGAADTLQSILEELDRLLDSTMVPGEYIEILVKCLGICFLTQIACDACKDAGQSAIASKLELAGKLSILAVSLPLFQELLSVAATLLAV